MMSDSDHIADLVKYASNADQLVDAQHVAAKRLLDHDGEIYPADGCAITLSVLLQSSGINVADVFRAIDLGNVLEVERNWSVVALGQQHAGDVGSTCGDTADHGRDHIYLVL